MSVTDCGHNCYFLKALFDEIIIARLNVYNRPDGCQIGLNCEPFPGRERLLRMFGATFYEDMTALQPEAQNKASSSSLPVKYSECKRLKHIAIAKDERKEGGKIVTERK